MDSKIKNEAAAVRRDKTVAESVTDQVHIVMPADMNDTNRLYGGVLMKWIDETAAIVGRRHAQMNVTTGTVENLRFMHGAYMRDTIVLHGKTTYVGNSSMEVKVESYVERMSGERILINVAYIILVGVDDNGRPQRLPRLILQTQEDRDEWEAAEKRRQLRDEQYVKGDD